MALVPLDITALALVLSTLALGVPSLLWLLHPITSNRASDAHIDGNITEISLVNNKRVESACGECDAEMADCVDISIIVPAYNEEARLPVMLEAALAYLEPWSDSLTMQGGKSKCVYEIVVVDDGSSDDTVGVALEIGNRLLKKTRSRNVIRVLKLPRNCGKGGAVKRGFLRARGDYILMADADGATEISEIANLYRKIKEIEIGTTYVHKYPDNSSKTSSSRITAGGSGLAIGSRAHMEEEAKANRAWYRTLLMRGLHLCVLLLCTRYEEHFPATPFALVCSYPARTMPLCLHIHAYRRVRDTQCGFKLFTRRSGRQLFGLLHLQRWAFDIEIIYLAGSSPITTTMHESS